MKRPVFPKGKDIWAFLLVLALFLSFLFSMVSISLVQILLTLAFIFWIIFLIQNKQMLTFPAFFWPLLVFTGLSLVSSARSVNPSISFRDSRELLLFLIIPMVYTAFAKKEEITRMTWALFSSGLAASLYAIFYAVLKTSPGERVRGFMGHYMTQAGILLLFCCLALSIVFFSREKTRYLWGAAFILAGVSLALTLTRSAWVGMAVALCLILFLWKPKALVLVPVLAGLVFLASPNSVKKRALSIFSTTSYSNQERLEYARAGIKIIRDFPLFGTGPDTVEMVFQNPKYELSWGARQNVHLHNNFTQIAAERGIPAFLAWLTFIIWAFFSLLKLLKNKDPVMRTLTAAALAAIAAHITAGFFEYNFGDSEVKTLLLLIITLPFALNRIQASSSQNKNGKI